ncbi:MAG: hypothetical protein QF805_16700 [Pirellulaceae bacterium]|nr:hypothetical protein [Pirellulaceae bacterium]
MSVESIERLLWPLRIAPVARVPGGGSRLRAKSSGSGSERTARFGYNRRAHLNWSMKERGVFFKLRIAFVLALRYIFLTRYSWLIGLLLVVLAPVSLRLFPALLGNLFVIDLPEQIQQASWIAFWCAAVVMETLRVTTWNAQHRFDDYRAAAERFRTGWGLAPLTESTEWHRRRHGWLTLVLGLVAAGAIWFVLMEACVRNTAHDPSSTWVDSEQQQLTGAGVSAAAWIAARRGLLVAVSILIALHAVVVIGHEIWDRRVRRHAAVGAAHPIVTVSHRMFGLLDRLLGPGYFRCLQTDSAGRNWYRLAPGHVGLLLTTIAFLTWYLVSYLLAAGDQPMPTESSRYPALFYGLLAILLTAHLLAGAAFYFDRYRVPVVLVMAGGMLLCYSFFDTDHYYELNPLPRREMAHRASSWDEVIEEREIPHSRQGRTLVVVDASGGGIQASAWTAQVLTGLHQRYGDRFSRSVGLISSVSGGSVGAMFYMAHRADSRSGFAGETVLTDESIGQIRRASRSSALEATLWGMAFPDAMRAIFPPLVNDHVDRGWAIERVWRQRLFEAQAAGDEIRIDDLRLTDLGDACRTNHAPAIVFNATIVETGQRLLISSVLSPPTSSRTSAPAAEFLREFPAAHPSIATAARLSATFPYVTPAARAHPRDDKPSVAAYHVVDGGYSDNEGAVTAVDWIHRLVRQYNQPDRVLSRPFDRILLIRIHAFPTTARVDERTPPAAGWRSALIGPLDAMMKVRVASQTERGDLEVDLLSTASAAEINAARTRFRADFRTAQAVVDTLKQQMERPAPPDLNLDPAEAARQMSEQGDRLRLAEMQSQSAAAMEEKVDALRIESVVFDFHSPQPVRIPLSWKLTERQKRNIDEAWEMVLSGEHPGRPLRVLDRYFAAPIE